MPQIEKIVEELKKEKDVLGIILYGSSLKGYKRSESDVDICVVAPEANREKLFKKILELMQDEKVDIKIFEDAPLYIKAKILKEGKAVYAKDEMKLFEYLWGFRKICEDEEISARKLS